MLSKILFKVGLICTLFLCVSCEKSISDTPLDKEQEPSEILIVAKPFTTTYGDVDIQSLATVKREGGSLQVTVADIKGDATFSKYILISDNRDKLNPRRDIYLWSTNMRKDLSQKAKESFTGDLNLIHLPTGDKLEYSITNGVKNKKRLERNDYLLKNAAPTHWECVKGCVNKTMDDMSWGETILCAVAFPECCAGVFLACEIDCTL
ncbi:MAG: hypothetical protein IT219_11230 [Bacteroidales bacterium]|nr:hypothetical protein [Bacteroidales bacterium]